MITIVFILAVLNLCLGFLLVASVEPISKRLVAFLTAGEAALPTESLPAPQTDTRPSAAPEPAAPTTPFDPQSLPRAWRDQLGEQRIQPASALEALLWMLKLRLAALREKLVHLECQLNGDENEAAHSHLQVLNNWRASQQEWIVYLGQFAQELTGLQDQPTDPELAAALKDLLQDHQFDAQQTATSLKILSDSAASHAAGGASNISGLRSQLSEQIDELHLVRDRNDDLLATLLRETGRLGETPEQLHIEGAAQIYNRIGFEVVLQEWRDANPRGERPVSCLLVDIDRFSQKNERFGNKTGDIVIAAFGGLLKSLIRIERGFDRVARFNGHSYLLFLGDTARDNALVVAERTRQCIEATSFKIGEDSFDVTTSLGLVEFDPSGSVADFYRALGEAVAAAKNAGRNRTAVHRGKRAEIAETAMIQVTGRVIEIDGQ